MKSIGVRELAYFICQSGSLTNEFFSNADLIRGQKAHDYLQNKYNEKSIKEFYIKQEIKFKNNDYILHGFIDGLLNINNQIIIEEIKSTTLELDDIDIDYHKEHLAQAKIYGYLYGMQNDLEYVNIRLTYVSVINYETKSFDNTFSVSELEEFFFNVLEEYLDFLYLLDDAKIKKESTIRDLKFPFEKMREGQKDLMKACFQAAKNGDILYAIAPTGIGKTMATMFSTLKALGHNEKLFYLTAKGSGKNAPIDAVKILAKKGLKIKTIDITAKQKICNLGEKSCNPENCPFAKGYFDRLKVATMDIIKNHDIYDRKTLIDISNKHKICAFEFSLYLSNYCDIIIADYNYLFDPAVRLTCYDDDTYKLKVLVDEAHNLISRSKEMYSASIGEADIKRLRRILTGFKPSIRRDANKVLEILDTYREKIVENSIYCDTLFNIDLNSALRKLINSCDELFDKNKNEKINNKDEALDAYFKIIGFLTAAEIYGPSHRHLAKIEEDNVIVNYYCLDASSYILDIIHSYTSSIVFFSATLYPISYHINLLTKGEGKYLELKSPFNTDNLDIIINNSISTKYKDREASIDEIVEIIETVVNNHRGNYIVFFPSYQYLNMVIDCLEIDNYELVIQESSFNDEKKEEIINKFKNENNKLGLFVMGGAFSEGIDLIGDELSGVIIVGVGLPMICDENNILKEYFDNLYNEGFDYAYTYPGMTKVIQAVGRVIRSEEDRGIAILIDTRFLYSKYLDLMPPHWERKKQINNIYLLKQELNNFFKKNE